MLSLILVNCLLFVPSFFTFSLSVNSFLCPPPPQHTHFSCLLFYECFFNSLCLHLSLSLFMYCLYLSLFSFSLLLYSLFSFSLREFFLYLSVCVSFKFCLLLVIFSLFLSPFLLFISLSLYLLRSLCFVPSPLHVVLKVANEKINLAAAQ